MTGVWGAASTGRESPSQRRALGASERRYWSSLIRQDAIERVLSHMADPQFRGVVILGPQGVGTTTLARSVVDELAATNFVLRLFGTGTLTDTPYSLFPVQLARLNSSHGETPIEILAALVAQMTKDAAGKPIVFLLDELPGVDTLSMSVVAHMVYGGKAKVIVVAHAVADLPEDLVSMVKDGLLAQQRLETFSRDEVRKLLVKALGGLVAESVVGNLHIASAGNPLVLQALVHEYVSSGLLCSHDGIWVSTGPLDSYRDDVIQELVDSRMARESVEVQENLKKFSLFKNVPLSLALEFLGAEDMSDLEERGFLSFGQDRQLVVTFAEPYLGETLRRRLSSEDKAALFHEISSVRNINSVDPGPQELLMFASWINEAGMLLEPSIALQAAEAALYSSEPRLALECLAHIPPEHSTAVVAAQLSSRAHYAMANYRQAAAVLEDISPEILASLTGESYASWALDLSVALVWGPEDKSQVDQLLAKAESRVLEATGEDRLGAEKFYNLAWFELQVHRGNFSEVLHELKIASKDSSDRSYRLNCASLLVMAYAATGRPADAIELAQAINSEAEQYGLMLRMNDWQTFGCLVALLWSGEWRQAEAALLPGIELSNNLHRYKDDAMDVTLGIVYAFAGQDLKAVEVLLVAAAQLEVRDSVTGMQLAYSALACVYAKLGDEDQSRRYLMQATAMEPGAVWVNQCLAEYFQAQAMLVLGDSDAVEQLIHSAEGNYQETRTSPAIVSMLLATGAGATEQYEVLGQLAQGSQGILATIARMLAQAVQENNAQMALDAADLAKGIRLVDIERHAVDCAVQCAKKTADMRLQRIAKHRAQALLQSQALTLSARDEILTPRERQVAQLAAHGMTNREISEEIGVSIRTAETHLYQVFAKLGATSRDELRTWVIT